MKIFCKKIILIPLFAFFTSFCFAEKTEISGLSSYKLENGLELYVLENDSAPLSYIEIAVKCGAFCQTKENAGLFHLYEHMMFKGNEKYSSQKEFVGAMNNLGVSDWNGSTSIDRVNYYFTVPSALTEQGLEFWSYAIRTPLLDENEFENEKKVVLSEIEGSFSDSAKIISSGILNSLFHENPWKIDTSGNPENIKNATVRQLKQIKEDFYIPQNTAIFVGTNLNADEVYSYVKKIFGDWKNPPSTNNNFSKNSKELAQTKKLVFADPRASSTMSQLVFYLRGPDCAFETEDTYAADVWSYLAANPDSSFVQKSISNKEFNIVDADYVSCGYSTMNYSGIISFSCYFLNDSKLSAVERSQKILDFWQNECVDDIFKEKTGFDEKQILKVEQKLEDSRIYSLETASSFLKELSSTWASSSFEYFLDYQKNINCVTKNDIEKFAEKYLKDKNGIVLLVVSPDYFEQNKEEFSKNGWEELTSENAFWWK